jgi:hypothetical protein
MKQIEAEEMLQKRRLNELVSFNMTLFDLKAYNTVTFFEL